MDKSASELEHERMQQLKNKIGRDHHPLIYALSRIVIPLSYAILIGLILSLVVHIFLSSIELGIRSLIVAALPLLVMTYFALFKRLIRHPKHIQKIPLYFASVGWMVITLAFVRFLVTHSTYGLNWGVLLLSTTLSILIFSRKYISSGASLSCSYGIVTGSFIHIAFFGFVIQ